MKLHNLALVAFLTLAGVVKAAPYESQSCQQDKADSCLDATPCKSIGGVTACLAGTANPPAGATLLAESCWQYQAAFTCRDKSSVDTCQPLRNRGCGQLSATCLVTNDQGRCTSYTVNFACEATPATTRETQVCETAMCAADGTGCFDTSRPADRDFGMAAASMEAAREAGVYGVGEDKIEIFKGYAEECSVKTIGGSSIKSCCEASGGGAGFTNYAVLGVPAKAAYAVGKEELKAGSKYMYDALFQAQDAGLVKSGASAAAGGLTPGTATGVAAQAGTQFGAYGFEFSYSASGGFSFVGFDPYSFAFAVAVQIITAWLQCDSTEQTMQLKRGQNLCVYLDTQCSRKVLGVCVERKQKHCCYNSILAKLLNRQGRAQLGMPMDQCGGFNEEQLQQIDFSRIDFSEFIATIVPTNTDSTSNTPRVTETVNKMIDDYYGSRDGQ
jgi:conjugal transfer mating pair stabilization protein TraN